MSNHVENMTQAKRESASSGAENIQMQINLNENHSVDCEMMDSTNSPPAQQASSNLVGWRLHGTTLGYVSSRTHNSVC